MISLRPARMIGSSVLALTESDITLDLERIVGSSESLEAQVR